MSFIDIYNNNVKRKKEEISRLKKERLKYVGIVSDSGSKILRAKQQANSTKSQATLKSKLNEITREEKKKVMQKKRLMNMTKKSQQKKKS